MRYGNCFSDVESVIDSYAIFDAFQQIKVSPTMLSDGLTNAKINAYHLR